MQRVQIHNSINFKINSEKFKEIKKFEENTKKHYKKIVFNKQCWKNVWIKFPNLLAYLESIESSIGFYSEKMVFNGE